MPTTLYEQFRYNGNTLKTIPLDWPLYQNHTDFTNNYYKTLTPYYAAKIGSVVVVIFVI
jgi:hypothetical protein